MNPIDVIGTFKQQAYPDFRNTTIDTLIWGSRRHHVPILLEVDVTEARELIRSQKRISGQGVSFTGWIVKCLGQAISEHNYVQAIRHGDRLTIFDDVDVAIIIERSVGQEGETLPMPYIIRKANEKTLLEIHSEIRAAQKSPVAAGEVQVDSPRAAWLTKIGSSLPRFVRDLFFWRPLFQNPFKIKQMMGTVSVTAIGMIGHGGLSWGVPIGIHPLLIAVGGIAKKPGITNEQMSVREYLGLTVMFDHDVTDGAPVARFIERFQELMEGGFGLEETLK
jgi:pyruvate/2-oxoglutarate dehydrogenase complex dihydrolipoamide acyltransferase (E2) component